MLLLIDSLGAIMTAFLLIIVMRWFHEYFGMPKIVLTYLSIVAVCFSIYSATCFLFLKRGWTRFIRLIGIANLLYCALTIGALYKYYPFLTRIGIFYFLFEIVIICGLSYVELKVVMRSKEAQIN